MPSRFSPIDWLVGVIATASCRETIPTVVMQTEDRTGAVTVELEGTKYLLHIEKAELLATGTKIATHQIDGKAAIRYFGQVNPGERVESQPVQFGADDWPGLFLRGDDCFAYYQALVMLLNETKPLNLFPWREVVEGLADALKAPLLYFKDAKELQP